MAIVFGDNQYGKAEVRLVRVTRDGNRHQLKDLNVSTALRGDFAAAHLAGDNSHIIATDTQKNTVFAFAEQYGVGEIEDFALRLGRHFVDSHPMGHRRPDQRRGVRLGPDQRRRRRARPRLQPGRRRHPHHGCHGRAATMPGWSPDSPTWSC